MGDRGNIAIITRPDLPITKGGAVWIYSHWGGYDMPKNVQTALAKKWRWDDALYLARIIFDVQSVGIRDQETGLGLSTGPADNEYDYIVVDPDKKLVHQYGWDRKTHEPTQILQSWPFEEYLLCDIEGHEIKPCFKKAVKAAVAIGKRKAQNANQ